VRIGTTRIEAGAPTGCLRDSGQPNLTVKEATKSLARVPKSRGTTGIDQLRLSLSKGAPLH